jgi:putative membrane protein
MWWGVLAALALTCIAPLYPSEMYLQHSATAFLLVAGPLVLRKFPLSNTSVFCIALFILLHIIGARWIYSYVPYDAWAKNILGTTLADLFGWHRNHYDRLVHFMFGFLLFAPIVEILQRYIRLSPRLAFYIAVEFLLAISALYELFEFSLTLALSPDAVENYNGQQGDMWDAQKDMALAFSGAVAAAALTALRKGLTHR